MALCAFAVACKEEEGPVATDPVGQPTPLAILETLSGAVTLQRGSEKRPASQEYLFAKDVIETASGASAKVRLSGGRTIEVGSDARFVLSTDNTGLVLEVERGLVLSRLAADTPRGDPKLNDTLKVSVLTPFGLTRVGAEPGEVSFEVKDGVGRVDVKLGTIAFVGKDGSEVKAGAGETLQVSAGKIEVIGRQEAPPIQLATMEVRIAPDGKSDIKKKGEQRWRPLSSKGAPLEAGDSVRVRTGQTSASFGSSSSRLTFYAGSEVAFSNAAAGAGLETSALELKSGKAMFALAADRKNRVELGGIQLESDLGGAFTIVRTGSGFEVAALAGDLVVRRGDKTHAVRAGEVARIGNAPEAEPEKAALPDDLLTLPSRGGLKVYHPGILTAAVTWAGGAKDYDIEIALDPQFQKKVVAGRVHNTRVNHVPVPTRGSMYWRIFDAETHAEVDNGNATFAPEPSARDLARLRNEVPEGTEKTTIYYQDKPPAVTFTFGEEPKAAQYAVKVFAADNLTSPVAERRSNGTRIALEEGVLGDGSYVWSATPLSAAGEELRGGRMNKLDITYDNSVPALVIKSPRNGESASGKIRASGIAPVNSNLIINGRPAPLDDKHRFDLVTSASGTPPALVFRLIRPASPDVYTVRTLAQRR